MSRAIQGRAKEIALRLGAQAEFVCRQYLSAGHREGTYWLVGDLRNTPGRSLYVRLVESGDGRFPPGKWRDAATGEHGDLLDIIARSCGHVTMRETMAEARHILGIGERERNRSPGSRMPVAGDRATAALRLFEACRPVSGTQAERYLRSRALSNLGSCPALRFHPRCWYRASSDDMPGIRTAWPALIASVTDLDGMQQGVHRTWLDPVNPAKAPVATPRRAMGRLAGHGVRFGDAGPVMAAGEGLETMLSLRRALPAMPIIAALSAAHLACLLFPAALRRLYVALDRDVAGHAAFTTLAARAGNAGIELVPLVPVLDDFNTDLRHFGLDWLRTHLEPQLMTEDAESYLSSLISREGSGADIG